MFFNLVWRNAKRSRGENLIYFLTMVTAAAAFYIVLSLREQDVIRFLGEIESDAVSRLLKTVAPAVYLCALLLVFSLTTFANKYQLECRSRELALYMLFGTKKKRLFLQVLAEGLITSLLALCGGIVCGSFLAEIISLTTARLVGQGIIAHQSSLSIRAIVLTGLGFLLIQAAALFLLGGQLFRKEIHQLLYGETAKKTANWKCGRQCRYAHFGSRTFDRRILDCFESLYGGRRSDIACSNPLRYHGNIVRHPGIGRNFEPFGGFRQKKNNTRTLYVYPAPTAGEYRK